MFRALNNSVYLRVFHSSSALSMPKKRNRETPVTESAEAHPTTAEPVSAGKSGIEIKILAKPGAKFNSVTDITDVVGVQIAAPPVEGEANSELLKYLAKVLDLKKSQVALDKGSRSRNKTVIVSGGNIEEILRKLHEERARS